MKENKDKNNRIDFEEIFKEENNKILKKQEDNKTNIRNSWIGLAVIIVYIIIFSILPSIIPIHDIIKNKKGATRTVSINEQIVTNVANKTNKIGIIDNTFDDSLLDKYKKYVAVSYIIKDDKDYRIIYNKKLNNKLIFYGNDNITYDLSNDNNRYSNFNLLLNNYINTDIYIAKDKKLKLTFVYSSNLPKLITTNINNNIKDKSIIINEDITKPTEYTNSIINFIIYIIAAVIIIPLCGIIIISDSKEYKNKVGSLFIKVGIGILLFFAGNVLARFIQEILYLIIKTPDTSNSLNQLSIDFMLSDKKAIAPMLISSIILAPIVEELVFRKSIFNIISIDWLSILISSLTFGLIHVTGELTCGNYSLALFNIVPYMTMGFVLGTYYKFVDKNIIPLILIHSLNNFIATMITILLN